VAQIGGSQAPEEQAGQGPGVAFLDDPRRLVILRGDIGHKDLWVLDLDTGAQRLLAVLPPDFTIGDFDISSDGTEIVFDRQQSSSYLALIELPTA
jgi:hypothetical protein